MTPASNAPPYTAGITISTNTVNVSNNWATPPIMVMVGAGLAPTSWELEAPHLI